MKYLNTYVPWVFSLALIAASCKTQRVLRSAPQGLSGSDWVVIEGGQPVISNGKRIYIHFMHDKFQGYAGCNTLFGSYTVRGENLSFHYMTHTQTKCADMGSEQALLDVLAKVDRFRIQGGEMYLYSGRVLLLKLRQQGTAGLADGVRDRR